MQTKAVSSSDTNETDRNIKRECEIQGCLSSNHGLVTKLSWFKFLEPFQNHTVTLLLSEWITRSSCLGFSPSEILKCNLWSTVVLFKVCSAIRSHMYLYKVRRHS
ncbi:hypothetical protein ACSQ67_015273 [Phaseolus vulgaris]